MEKQTSNLVKLISGAVIGLAALTVVLPTAGCMGARIHPRLGRVRVVIIAPGRHYPSSYFRHYPSPYSRYYQRGSFYFGFPQRRLPGQYQQRQFPKRQYHQGQQQKRQDYKRPQQKRQPRRQEQRREHPRRGFGHRQQR